MEQQGLLIGRLPLAPFSLRNWRENTGKIMPRPPHGTEFGHAGPVGSPCPSQVPHQSSPGSAAAGARSGSVEKELLAVPGLQCVCFWVNEPWRMDRAALRSGSIRAGFVDGPCIFLHCACKRRVKLSASTKPTMGYMHAYMPVNSVLDSSRLSASG